MDCVRRVQPKIMSNLSPDYLRQQLTREVPSAYQPLIEQMKFYIEPEISCSRFFGMACFTEESIKLYREANDLSAIHLLEQLELGKFIAEHVKNGLFIDIPCGYAEPKDPHSDFAMVPLARALGLSEYWEVDISIEAIADRVSTNDVIDPHGHYQLSKSISAIGIRTDTELEIATMQDDLLGFLTKFSDEQKRLKAIYISALQPDANLCKSEEAQQQIAAPYLTALYNELSRVCNPGDLVILNSSSMLVEGINEERFPHMHPTLALPPKGFTLMRRDAFDKVQVFRKE